MVDAVGVEGLRVEGADLVVEEATIEEATTEVDMVVAILPEVDPTVEDTEGVREDMLHTEIINCTSYKAPLGLMAVACENIRSALLWKMVVTSSACVQHIIIKARMVWRALSPVGLVEGLRQTNRSQSIVLSAGKLKVRRSHEEHLNGHYCSNKTGNKSLRNEVINPCTPC